MGLFIKRVYNNIHELNQIEGGVYVASIKDIEGISERYASLLIDNGIRTTEQLLEYGATSSARMRLADETHLTEDMIKAWVHQADLFRIKGIANEYAMLLCSVGVCTIPKLAYRSAESLFAEINELNAKKRLVERVPSVHELESFIIQAKLLPKLIRH